MEDPDILLTNDDGIDANGLHALYDALSSVGSVTVVSPLDDQSAVGRTRSQSVAVHEHELGYTVDGTPVDCVIAGVNSLLAGVDLVVAGCNQGANLGSAVLGRSGTVSAAVEAAFLGVPAMAVSMYIPTERFANGAVDRESYTAAVGSASYLAERAGDAGLFERADYLNVNAPIADNCTGEMSVTRPSTVYRMGANRDGGTVRLHDSIWEEMNTGTTDDPPGTDRHAIVENRISVSPLSAPHTTEQDAELAALADDYTAAESRHSGSM
jgi:5'-nucleotidase